MKTIVITAASQKGGSGKSTIAINLALTIAALNSRPMVALIDTDEQKSCVETLSGNERDNLLVIAAAEKPHIAVEELKNKSKPRVIIIDTPPHSHAVMHQAALVSDLVIIPVQPSPLDVRAVSITSRALATIQAKANKKLLVRFLVNRLTSRTTLANEIRAVLEKLYPHPVLGVTLHDRQAYKLALISGQAVSELGKNSPAAEEFGQLTLEVTKLLKGIK